MKYSHKRAKYIKFALLYFTASAGYVRALAQILKHLEREFVVLTLQETVQIY